MAHRTTGDGRLAFEPGMVACRSWNSAGGTNKHNCISRDADDDGDETEGNG